MKFSMSITLLFCLVACACATFDRHRHRPQGSTGPTFPRPPSSSRSRREAMPQQSSTAFESARTQGQPKRQPSLDRDDNRHIFGDDRHHIDTFGGGDRTIGSGRMNPQWINYDNGLTGGYGGNGAYGGHV